jgi:hypothetical protein
MAGRSIVVADGSGRVFSRRSRGLVEVPVDVLGDVGLFLDDLGLEDLRVLAIRNTLRRLFTLLGTGARRRRGVGLVFSNRVRLVVACGASS